MSDRTGLHLSRRGLDAVRKHPVFILRLALAASKWAGVPRQPPSALWGDWCDGTGHASVDWFLAEICCELLSLFSLRHSYVLVSDSNGHGQRLRLLMLCSDPQ